MWKTNLTERKMVGRAIKLKVILTKMPQIREREEIKTGPKGIEVAVV